MIGMSYIFIYFNKKNFKFFLFNQTFGNDNKSNYKKYLSNKELCSNDFKDGSILPLYQELFDIIKEKNLNKNNNYTYFVVMKNLPYELYLMSLKDKTYAPNFIKNWKPTILQFFDEINNLLEKDDTKIKLLFITDDKEIDEFELKTIFPNKIIEHPLTKNIICNPISNRKMYDILSIFLNAFNPQIIEENNIKQFIDSIYLEFNSNLHQILDYLLLTISGEYYQKIKNKQKSKSSINHKPMTQKGKTKLKGYSESQNNVNIKINKNGNNYNNIFKVEKEKVLDHDLFRLLGKLLYNKRYVVKDKTIQKLKKEQFGNNFETPRYYDINELINDIPIMIY